MATFSKGILGGFSGTVGTVVGATWRGIQYMRSRAARRSRTFSEAQLQQQAKFALFIRFLRPLADLLSITFKGFGDRMSGMNAAFSYALKNAVKGSYPDYSIDYTRVLISRGDLVNVSAPTVSASATSTVTFQWSDNSGVGQAKANDNMIIVLYCPDLRKFIYTIGTSNRSSASESIDARLFAGHEVDTFISVISDNEKEVAESMYTGAVTVS